MFNRSMRIKLSLLIYVLTLLIIRNNALMINFTDNEDTTQSDFDMILNSLDIDTFLPNWADSRFKYRKNITIQASKVISDLNNFPVLIELYDADLKNSIQANANDLMFTDDTNKELDFEVEHYNHYYNSTHSHLQAWVKTNISCNYDTILVMYYGNTSLDNQERSKDVWDEKFVAVWHLSETTVPRYDSTRNMIDASPQNYDNDEAVEGKIDGADNLDGTDDYIETYRFSSELGLGEKNPKTVSAWVYTKNFTGGGIFEFGKLDTSKGYFSLGTLPTTNKWQGNWGGTQFNDFTYDSLDNWVHFSVVYDGDKNIRIYADGKVQVNENNTKLNIINDLTLKIGKWGNNSFNGIIDEVRVSVTARSENWIKTEYNNQDDPNSFIIVGLQEFDTNAPILNDFGVIETSNENLIFYSDLTDDLTVVENVIIRINGSEFEMSQNISGVWVYQYQPVNFGDYFVYQIANASDSFENHLTISSIEKNFTYTKDLAPPRVINAYFVLNEEKNQSNLTFFTEIEEHDSGIKGITLSYYFEETNLSTNLGGGGSELFQEEEIHWINATMEFYEKSDQYHIYAVTVPFSPKNNTSWKVIYKISTSDYSGNIDENAFSVDQDKAENNTVIFYSSIPIFISNNSPSFGNFIPSIVFLNIIFLIVAVLVVSSVYVQFFRKPVLVGLDKNLVMKNVDKVSDRELKTSINDHTHGIVLSIFDQRTGPVPYMVVPISSDNDANMLLKLSFRAFSNCELVDNFNDEKEAIFNFTYSSSNQNIPIKSLTYSFSLYRPGARNNAENITLSILINPTFFPLVNQFTDKLSGRIKKIHNLLDKHPEEKIRILSELEELRKCVSKIILAYSHVYRNGEYLS